MKLKKVMSVLLAVTLAFSLAACGGNNNSSGSDDSGSASDADGDAAAGDTSSDEDNDTAADSGTATSSGVPAIYDLTLGEDYTDLEADVYVLTHRTDIVDTTFQDYITEFNEMYPNIKVEYEAVTDYATDVTTRLTTEQWGDICMIPTTIDKDELSNMFLSYGNLSTIDETYNFASQFAFDGQVYGIASTGNVQGIVYNKKVFEEAGIAELPTTPDDFLDALQAIKDNTDAIPMYSNFAAGWTMGAWDAYIGGTATGSADFMKIDLVHSSNPFSKRDDMTGPYAVYYVLYEATARGLIEDDPSTTDWEGSKAMINNGEVGCMVLGSWAVVQMQEGGPNPDDIAYMSFPITVGGEQYATAGADYNYGINVNSDENTQIAAMLYVKYLTEQSGFSYDEGGIPIVKGEAYPDTLEAFSDIELVIDNPALEGEETLFDKVNNESEIGLNSNDYTKSDILEAALTQSKTLDEIMDDWNARWTEAQEKYDVEIYE